MPTAPRVNAPRTRLLRGLVTITACAGLTITAACSPGSGGSKAANVPSGDVTTTVPSGKVSLRLAYYETGGNGDAVKNLVKAYEKLHPNVSIQADFTDFVDYGKSIKLTMSSASAPDIAEVGQAYTMEGPLVQAGLLRPLDNYEKAYGWDTRFKPGLLDESRFQTDGKSFGKGHLYGMALGGNMVGIYYNKQLVQKLGIKVPFATLDDFTAALAKAKAAGVLPVEFGNQEQWEGNHLLSVLISQYQPATQLTSWIYGRRGATFDTSGVQKAATTLQDWAKKGYLDPAANGTTQDDATAKFGAGKSVFFVSGNWALTAIDKSLGSNAGFTAFPPATAGSTFRATGATTSPYGISSKSKHADVAANFIDFMTRPQNAQILSAGGYAPISATPTTGTISPLQQQFNDVYAKVLADDGLTLYLDWATVSMGTTLFPAVQELIAGKTSPKSLISTVQADWNKAHTA